LGEARGTNRVPPHEVNGPTWAIGSALSPRTPTLVVGHRSGWRQLESNTSVAVPEVVGREVAAAIGIQPDAHTPMLGKDSQIRIAVMVHVGRDERYHPFPEVQYLNPAARHADDHPAWRDRRQLDRISDSVAIEVGDDGCGCPLGDEPDRRKQDSDQRPNTPERAG
jgi:hypothetical protein